MLFEQLGHVARPFARVQQRSRLDEQAELADEHGKEAKRVFAFVQLALEERRRLGRTPAAQRVDQVKDVGRGGVGRQAGHILGGDGCLRPDVE